MGEVACTPFYPTIDIQPLPLPNHLLYGSFFFDAQD
jgi:hypothetical protein